MILRELFYFDDDTKAMSQDHRFDTESDSSKIARKDTRKTRLTLRQINELRKASELHLLEQERELEFIEQMYKPPAEPVA